MINDNDNGQNLLGLLSLMGPQGFMGSQGAHSGTQGGLMGPQGLKQNTNTNTDRFEPGGGGVPHPYGQHQNRTIKKRSRGDCKPDHGGVPLVTLKSARIPKAKLFGQLHS